MKPPTHHPQNQEYKAYSALLDTLEELKESGKISSEDSTALQKLLYDAYLKMRADSMVNDVSNSIDNDLLAIVDKIMEDDKELLTMLSK